MDKFYSLKAITKEDLNELVLERNILKRENQLLKDRIEKVIEYMDNNKIDNYEVDGTPLFCGLFNELLEILKGEL